MLDRTGKVIGILIAGSVDCDTGVLVPGETFVLPASVIAADLAANGVTARASATTVRYETALDDYDRHYYKRALAGFRQVQVEFPEHPCAAHFAGLSRQRIAAGDDRTPNGFKKALIFWAFGLIVVVALLALLLLVVVIRQKRSPRPAGYVGSGWPGWNQANQPPGWNQQPTAPPDSTPPAPAPAPAPTEMP